MSTTMSHDSLAASEEHYLLVCISSTKNLNEDDGLGQDDYLIVGQAAIVSWHG